MGQKTIIVAGGSRGVGAAVVHDALAEGERVIIVDFLPPQEDNDALFVSCDLSDSHQVETVLGALGAREERIDALVIAAGHGANGSLMSRSAHEWGDLIANEVLSVVEPARVLLPKIIETGRDHDVADIIVIGSIAGDTAFPNAVVYGAGSAARNAFGEQLRAELYDEHVRVRSIHLGFTDTGHLHDIDIEAMEDRASLFAESPLLPEDVSRVIMHMLGQAPHVNAHDIVLVPTIQGWA